MEANEAASGSGVARVALIGYGSAGSQFHAPQIHATPGLQLAGIVTRNRARIAEARRRYPQAKILSSIDEVCEGGEKLFDLAVVATPPQTHAELAMSALRAGLHVVVDKPATVTSEELDSLIVTASKRDLLLTVYQNQRWESSFLTARNVITSGVLGRIVRFESRLEMNFPTFAGANTAVPMSQGGGVLYAIGSHTIDQAIIQLGAPQRFHVHAGTPLPGQHSDSDSAVLITHVGGASSYLSMSVVTAKPGPRFRIVGSQGIYTDEHNDPTGSSADPSDLPALFSNAAELTSVQRSESEPHQFYAQLQRALSGTGDLPVNALESLSTIRIIESSWRDAPTN
jgi:scyllo-inositol 2-dehydrogenase (NADP+)